MAELYMALNGKYPQDADRLLAAGDFTQASEKYWGTVAEIVKAIAERRGWRHASYRDLRRSVEELRRETGDNDLLRLFAVAESMQANFYENFMSEDTIQLHAADAHTFIAKLQPVAA